jgi:hypothetical protein
MTYSRFLSRICKLCALVVATLILPVLAYAGRDNSKGNNGKHNGQDKIHSVPEGGPGIVLSIATISAVLLFSSRRFLSANLAEK